MSRQYQIILRQGMSFVLSTEETMALVKSRLADEWMDADNAIISTSDIVAIVDRTGVDLQQVLHGMPMEGALKQ